MPRTTPLTITAVLTTALLALLPLPQADACNIPVFRYALERWKPDLSEVIVFHDGPLADGDQDLADRLASHTRRAGGHANADVILVDVNDDDADLIHQQRLGLWRELLQTSDASLPHVVVRTKLGRGQFVNHWHGTLAEAASVGIFQSPVRAEIQNRLLQGDSVVWLLIKSDDKDKNAAAKRLALETFQTLDAKIKLPEGIGLPGSELYAQVPLVVKFSLLEIDGKDDEETFLTSLLTGIRRQAYEEGEPLLVPVFGRGRALEVIPAQSVSPKLIEELTVFLSGACSCQVKEQNPGFDLLIDVDWDFKLFGDAENRPPDRSEQEGLNRNPTLVPIPSGRK